MRTNDPRAERGGCLHARMFGVVSGYEFRESKSNASLGTDRGGTGRATGDPLRQRAGVHESSFSGVVRGAGNRVGAHPSREPTQNAYVESFNGRKETLEEGRLRYTHRPKHPIQKFSQSESSTARIGATICAEFTTTESP